METRAAACRKDTKNFLVLGQTVKSFRRSFHHPSPREASRHKPIAAGLEASPLCSNGKSEFPHLFPFLAHRGGE